MKHHHLFENWNGKKIESTIISIMHSLFANDTLVFGASIVSEAKRIKKNLFLYLEVLG